MNYWDVVEATRNILDEPVEHINHGISRVKIEEGVGARIQHAAMDWLSTEFGRKGLTPEQVLRELEDDTDKYYDSWVDYAKEIYGLNKIAAQETGWEMILGGAPTNGNRSLVHLPGGDRYY